MRVFDCLIVNGRTDLLQKRMEALEDIPEVTHVICEAVIDEQGKPQPLFFWENRLGVFARFHGRWNHVRVEAHELPVIHGFRVLGDLRTDMIGGYEITLREYLMHGVNGDPGDVIFAGKLGEIPDPGMIRKLAAGNLTSALSADWRIHRPGELAGGV
jgi:hypothetical protein